MPVPLSLATGGEGEDRLEEALEVGREDRDKEFAVPDQMIRKGFHLYGQKLVTAFLWQGVGGLEFQPEGCKKIGAHKAVVILRTDAKGEYKFSNSDSGLMDTIPGQMVKL